MREGISDCLWNSQKLETHETHVENRDWKTSHRGNRVFQ